MIPKNLKSFEQVILNRSVLATDPLPATKLDVRPRFEPWIFCWQSGKVSGSKIWTILEKNWIYSIIQYEPNMMELQLSGISMN